MNFIKSRMNRDNFWNLVFWVGMTSGLVLTYLLDKQGPLVTFITIWSTILGVPLIVSLGSKVSFNKNELTFFNSNGESLKDRRPNGIFIVLTIAITALIGIMLDANTDSINDTVAIILLFAIFFLVPTLYFIYKNCPIAILFSRHAWFSKIPGIKNDNEYPTRSRFFSSEEQYIGIEYRYLPWNIHHKR